MPFNILDIVQSTSKRVVHIDDQDFPVGLALVEESHDAEDLDLLDLTNISNLFADLADVQRIVIALGLGLSVSLGGVFPSLLVDA